MLDINQYFFWQLINFFLLFIVLNHILFKPFLRLFEERKLKTQGALDEARSMHQQKDEYLGRINEKLSEARGKAKDAFDGLSNEGLEVQKETVESAQKEAMEINRKAKEELEAAAEKARSALKSDVEAFSRKIVDKMVSV